MARHPEGVPELNLSASSWSEDRELDDQCNGMGSSPTYAAAASKKTPTVPAATAGLAEEGADLLYQQQQTSAPRYCHFWESCV